MELMESVPLVRLWVLLVFPEGRQTSSNDGTRCLYETAPAASLLRCTVLFILFLYLWNEVGVRHRPSPSLSGIGRLALPGRHTANGNIGIVGEFVIGH